MNKYKKDSAWRKEFFDSYEKGKPVAPWCFYYKEKNKFIVIDNSKFSIETIEFEKEKDALAYCKDTDVKWNYE